MANSFDFNRANRNTKNEAGWCERWVEQGFGFNGIYNSAWDSWQASSKRPSGIPPSDGNYYLVYFDGWWKGKHYGDVALYRNGKVWSGSDPKWRSGTSFSTYKSWIGTSYLGWSEYLGNKKIATIKEATVAKLTTAQINKAYQELLGRKADDSGLKHYLASGFTDAQMRADIKKSAEYKKYQAALAAKAKAEAAAKAVAATKAKEEAAKKAAEEAAKAAKSETDKLVAENNGLLKSILALLQKIAGVFNLK